MDIEIIFHNGNAGGARGADRSLHILDRLLAPLPCVNDIAHETSAGALPGKPDIARHQSIVGKGLDLGFQTIGAPRKAGAIQNDVIEAKLGVTADPLRIDLGIGDRPQTEMRRVRAFRRQAVTSLRPLRQSRRGEGNAGHAQRAAAIHDAHKASPYFVTNSR
jgi:hypothetical protein